MERRTLVDAPELFAIVMKCELLKFVNKTSSEATNEDFRFGNVKHFLYEENCRQHGNFVKEKNVEFEIRAAKILFSYEQDEFVYVAKEEIPTPNLEIHHRFYNQNPFNSD